MILANEIVRAVLSYTAPNTSVMQNVFYYQLQLGDLANDSMMDILEDYFTDVWGDSWAVLAPTNATLESFSVDILNTDGTVDRNIGERDLSIPGTAGVSVSPAAVAGYFYASTTVPKARGSKYVPAISESVIDAGVFNATGITELSLMLIGYLADLVSGGSARLVPGVLSRPLEAFVEFTAQGLVNDVPAYQRRRKPNVGS